MPGRYSREPRRIRHPSPMKPRTIHMPPPQVMRPAQRHNLLIREAHTVEDEPDVVRPLRAVRQPASRRQLAVVDEIRAAWLPGDFRAAHFFYGDCAGEGPEVCVGYPDGRDGVRRGCTPCHARGRSEDTYHGCFDLTVSRNTRACCSPAFDGSPPSFCFRQVNTCRLRHSYETGWMDGWTGYVNATRKPQPTS